MRLLIVTLFAALSCARTNADEPVEPQIIASGTFYGFDVYGQAAPPRGALVLVEDDTHRLRVIDLYSRPTTVPVPLSVGEHVVLTKTGSDAFSLEKRP